MSMWSRLANLFRADRLNREIDEELQSHVDEAIAQGRDPAEARRALGPALRLREESRDIRLVVWLDSLRADAIFGWRQLTKNKVTSAAATLSLALAIGSCTAAFRLIDALLLRPLPVADPERLYVVAFERILPGQRLAAVVHSCSYPLFREMRGTVKDDAELVAVSYAQRVDVTYGAYQDMEKASRQYVSGWMFSTLGLRPALGRVLTGEDDLRPGAHPYAVLSYDYWTRRFGREAEVIGRTFRMGNDVYEVVGVLEERFSGTEPGTPVDIFVPTMMNAASIDRPNAFWFRTFVRPKSGASVESMRERLQAMHLAWERERAKGFTNFPKERLAQQINQTLRLDPAAAGVSALQRDYRLALAILAVLVALVLLIACANVANLMTARAAARSREMALRVSIGAGRRRLVQLVLLEAAWIALLAAAIGTVFASWAAPFIVSMINPPDNPARLFLSTDWRVVGFGLALTLMVTCLFGLLPAWRASGVRPIAALKGGEDPHARRQTMHALIVVQVAFCFVVLFIGNLLVVTQNQLESQPLGFAAERLLVLETVSQTPQVPAYWDDVAEGLRAVPGVERVAMSRWPLLGGEMSNNFVWIAGAPPADVLTFFLEVSPDWRDAMKIPLTSGRDFRANDRHPGVALVNATFARQYFRGEDPVGSWFETREANGSASRFEIVGLVGDARYNRMHGPIPPIAYVPMASFDANGALRADGRATFVVRTASDDPLAIAAAVRQAVPRTRSEFRVSNLRTQQSINDAHTIRERLLALLALFFSSVALVLAGVGLYGVLHYSVLRRQREIGIRMALGARAPDVARRVTLDVFVVVIGGAVIGGVLGHASERYIESLLYGVEAADLRMMAIPSVAIVLAAVIAAVPPVIYAVRIDPVRMLRSE